jgi:hypothetical protein
MLRLFGHYGKRGGRLFVGQVKSHLFGGSKARLTTALCEKFFEDEGKFLLPERD